MAVGIVGKTGNRLNQWRRALLPHKSVTHTSHVVGSASLLSRITASSFTPPYEEEEDHSGSLTGSQERARAPLGDSEPNHNKIAS